MTGATQVTSWSPQLRAAGLRVTQPRVSVLRVLDADPHLSADQVTERVRAELGTVSTPYATHAGSRCSSGHCGEPGQHH